MSEPENFESNTDSAARRDAPEASTITAPAADPAGGSFSGDAGATTLRGSIQAAIDRVRGGDAGALPAFLGLVILLIVFGTQSNVFLTRGNIANLPAQAAPTILIGMGLVFVLLLGEIDLSAGTAAGVCAATMALAVNHVGKLEKVFGGGTYTAILLLMIAALAVAVWQKLWPAAVIILLGVVVLVTTLSSHQVIAMFLAVSVGTGIGTLTGILVARVGIPSFVVTLALFLAWQGVILKFLGNGNAITVRDFSVINALGNKNVDPLWGWIVFVVSVGGYAAVTLRRSIARRLAKLSAEPISLVVVRAAVLGVLGAVAVYLLNKERSPNPVHLQSSTGGKCTVISATCKQLGTSIKGLPWTVPVILVLLVLLTLLLSKTAFGRHLYAVGGNAEAARRAGIDVPRMRVAAFGWCTTLAAVGGIALASDDGGVPSDIGGGNTLLFAVGAAVIGGTSLFGGRGRMRDAVLGGLVIGLIPNGLILLNLQADYNYMITGLVLLFAASADALSRRRRRS